MKKVTLMLAALALVLGISQCKKQGTPQQAGEKQYIELTADNGNNGSKVDVDFATIPSVMNLTWEEGDVITVSGGATGTLTLDRGVGTSQGHFSGEITTGSGDVVFTYKKAAQQNRGSDDPDFNNQDGTEEWIKANLVLQATSEYHDNGKYSLTMEMPYAVLKLNLSELVGTKNDVTISAGNGAVATVKNLTKANSEEVYMAVPEVGEHTYTFSGNDATAKKPWTLEANTYYTANTEGAAIVIELLFPAGALPGLFTVNGSGKQVYFSKGNLWADGSNVLHFEDAQWKSTPASNGNMVAGHVSHFTWSSTVAAAVSTSNSGNNLFCDESHKQSVNGGKPIYYALSKAEWQYLLGRTMPGNKPCYTNKTDGINIGGTTYKGLFIYPDNYNGTEVGTDGTTDTWSKINDLGIVFLPAAGYHSNNNVSVENVGNHGKYWSSSPNEDYAVYADYLLFSTGVNPDEHTYRGCGFSVRLVTEK